METKHQTPGAILDGGGNMRVSCEWLQEYLSEKVPPALMVQALENAGMEIEQIISAKPLDKNVVVGLVKKVAQHPTADRLKIAQVDIGHKQLNIVCGASNLEENQKVAVALAGAVLPSGEIIKSAVIRGEASDGMIASSKELGIGTDHSGIFVLGSNTEVGTKLSDLWPEATILEVKTPANRPDTQSVIGLAREIAAVSNYKLSTSSSNIIMPDKIATQEVMLDEKAGCRRYMLGWLVLGSQSGSTPDWMSRRLLGAGLRPINLVVDITNYVMLETGQPLHAFDAGKVKLPISVRQAKKGEAIKTLDGQDRELQHSEVVIADAKGPIAIAGVMGAKAAEVSGDTREILLESATFDPGSTRKAALRLGLRTAASARYERGLPVRLAEIGLARAVELLADLAGAKLVEVPIDVLDKWPWVTHIGLQMSRLDQLIGMQINPDEAVDALNRLGYVAERFDITKFAKRQLGKPYIWGAKYKTHADTAFDCSYLTDYLYSLIGVWIGHTSLAQYDTGREVDLTDIKPGDLVFYRGFKDKSDSSGTYFQKLADGTTRKIKSRYREFVGHNGIYIGNNQVVDARQYYLNNGKWELLPEQEQRVQIVPLETYSANPEFLGVRRYVDDLDEFIAVTVPWWRPDVVASQDVIEEVARMIGYDKVPAKMPTFQISKFAPDRWWPRIWELKSGLKALGLFEVMTYSFVSKDDIEIMGQSTAGYLKLKNPMSLEQAYLRSDLLASLLRGVSQNIRHSRNFGMYEISHVFHPRKGAELPDEPTVLGVINFAKDNAWQGAKAALDVITHQFGLDINLKDTRLGIFHPNRGVEIRFAGNAWGRMGEVHPEILEAFGIKGSVGYLEINLGSVLSHRQSTQAVAVSRFPVVMRDIAIVVTNRISWSDVDTLVKGLGYHPQYLSEYRGQDLPKDHKSLAFRVEITHPESTLTDPEADKHVSEILAALKRKYNASER